MAWEMEGKQEANKTARDVGGKKIRGREEDRRARDLAEHGEAN